MGMDCIDYPETSLLISLPEELGILGNVWVHITLSNGRYVPIEATLCPHFRHYSETGAEWPNLYNEDTKQQLFNWEINKNGEPNTTVFGIIYTCYDSSFFKGSFVVTFTSWKEEILRSFYTETVSFDFNDDEFL